MRQTIVVLGCFLLTGILFAQKTDHIFGDLLVQMQPKKHPDHLVAQFQSYRNTPTDLIIDEYVSAHMNIYKLTFNHATVHEYDFLTEVRSHPDVLFAQFNHVLKKRQTIPDDPQFANQWQYINTGQSGGVMGADLDMDLAWDTTTGGVTPNGDTIVICVIDDEFNLSHPDLVDNLWRNHAEIPDNGIDDDMNGYVDDYLGWDVGTETDDFSGFGGHGTSVAGIVGAKGNNGIGVAGVNWDVQMMLVNLSNVTESNVLSAYSYPLDFRIRYNETNGAEGAFVVATNTSWGLDFGQPDDAPIWCSFYDTLGHYGILNCGATINAHVDVDVQGDLPTGCLSDYLISVTNVNDRDEIVFGAGFGATSIDIGAFGESTWTVSGSNGYGGFGGTSGATPHVTGAIGLIYALNCPLLTDITQRSPGEAALLIKDALLNSVDPNPSLEAVTVSGGRLNINSAIEYMNDFCSACPKPFGIEIDSIVDVSASLSWGMTDSVQSVSILWRPMGSIDWNTSDSIISPYRLEGLMACTEYEFTLISLCADTMVFSDTITFESEGCCKLPEDVDVDIISDTSAMVSWTDIFAGVSYSLAIRNTNETTYDTVMTVENGLILDGLDPCTEYEIRLLTNCDTAMTDFSGPMFFITSGCGACLDFEYCEATGETEFEWIDRISFGPLENESGDDDGFAFFSDLNPYFFPGVEYRIELIPGFSSSTFEEQFSIWIDLDQNGVFEDSIELVYQTEFSSADVLDTISIPVEALEGSTRMRVVMNDGAVQTPSPCNNIPFGEIEDYCIELGPAQIPCANVDSLRVDGEVGTSAMMIWEMVDESIVFNYRYKKFNDTEWEEPQTTLDTFAVVEELEECTVYEFQVRTICPADTSQFSESLTFATFCPTGINAPEEINGITIFPNPFSHDLTVKINADIGGAYEVRLMDLNGNTIDLQQPYIGASTEETIRFDRVDQLPAGIYLISIQNGNRLSTKKVLKM